MWRNPQCPGRRMDLTLEDFAAAVGSTGPVAIAGLGTRSRPLSDVRVVNAPIGIEWIEPAEMTIRCGAGTPVDEVDAALAEHGQQVAVHSGGTVGGALAVGQSGIRRLAYGAMRDALLAGQLRQRCRQARQSRRTDRERTSADSISVDCWLGPTERLGSSVTSFFAHGRRRPSSNGSPPIAIRGNC